MTTNVDTRPLQPSRAPGVERGADLMRYVVPLGRLLFVAIFLEALPGHFRHATIAAAAQHGVPLAAVAVPLSGIVAFVGALSVLLGVRARVGAWLLVLFLVPVTLTMHDFWHYADPLAARMQY